MPITTKHKANLLGASYENLESQNDGSNVGRYASQRIHSESPNRGQRQEKSLASNGQPIGGKHRDIASLIVVGMDADNKHGCFYYEVSHVSLLQV